MDTTATPETTAPSDETVTEATTEDEAPVAPSPPEPPDLTPAKLFRYSTYVHVGEGAEECPDGENGRCKNPDHFHAWCRLPNQFQQEKIRRHALAAKARRERQYRDPDSDSHVILEHELESIRKASDAHKLLVEEVLGREFLKHHRQAIQEVNEDERFAHIDEDLERFSALRAMDPDERPQEEFEELQRHLEAYNKAVEKARDEAQRPMREALEQKGVDDLIDMVRDDRIAAESQEAFMRTFSMWEWVYCTLKPRDPAKGRPTERIFGSIEELEAAAPEVTDAIDRAFESLEGALTEGGNS